MSKREIQIIEIEWEEIGDEDTPRSRLLASIEIAGCAMHLEAVEVREGERRASVDVEAPEQEFADDAPEWIKTALAESADYEPVMLAEIEGRTYALIATPHQQ